MTPRAKKAMIHGFLSAKVIRKDGTEKQLACMKHNLN